MTVQGYFTDDWAQWIKFDLVSNAPQILGHLSDICDVITSAKLTQTHLPRKVATQAKEKLDRFSTDLMSSITVYSPSGFEFCSVFEDHHTKTAFADLLKAKTEVPASLKKFVLSVGTPKHLRQNCKNYFPREK